MICKFLKQVGPNKQVRWRKKAVNLKRVGLLLVEFQKKVPNKYRISLNNVRGH